MVQLAERITDAELEIMKVLWENGDALSVSEVRHVLQVRIGWEASTVKTLIQRLHQKGVLAKERRGKYVYRPLISREEFNDWAIRDLTNRLGLGSVKDLMITIIQSDCKMASDLTEIFEVLGVENYT